MIDTALRSKGIGGSEIAAICGLDPRRDQFAVYAEKLGLVERSAPSPRMIWGKRIERVIAEAYAAETKLAVSWWDRTIVHPERSWQVSSPDAFVTESQYDRNAPLTDKEIERFRIGGVDAKNVAFDQAHAWGEPGTDTVPEHISLQCQWYMSATALPWWDIAALFGGYDLRIYRVQFDPEIEAVLLAEAEGFWTKHVLAKVPPPIGSSATAAEYLRQRFPKNISTIRPATPEETELLSALKDIRQKFGRIEAKKKAVENEVKQAIGDADGLTWGKDKVTLKLCKDTTGTDWMTIAMELHRVYSAYDVLPPLASLDELAAKNQVVTKRGSRRLLVPRSWGAEE